MAGVVSSTTGHAAACIDDVHCDADHAFLAPRLARFVPVMVMFNSLAIALCVHSASLTCLRLDLDLV